MEKLQKQTWLRRTTSTLLSHKQPARNQAIPPPSLWPKLFMKMSWHCFLFYSTKAARNNWLKWRQVTNLPFLWTSQPLCLPYHHMSTLRVKQRTKYLLQTDLWNVAKLLPEFTRAPNDFNPIITWSTCLVTRVAKAEAWDQRQGIEQPVFNVPPLS